jgi:hypothetical protein
MAITEQEKAAFIPLLPRINEELGTPPEDPLFDMIQQERRCWLVPGSPQKIEIDVKGRMIEITLKPSAPDLATSPYRPFTVCDVESVRRLPFTAQERERDNWLKDLEDGTLTEVSIDEYGFIFDASDDEIRQLEETGMLVITINKNGERVIKTADILKMNAQIETMRAAEEAGQ